MNKYVTYIYLSKLKSTLLSNNVTFGRRTQAEKPHDTAASHLTKFFKFISKLVNEKLVYNNTVPFSKYIRTFFKGQK